MNLMAAAAAFAPSVPEGIPMLVFLIVWGAAVIADSGVFSTSLSENADPRYIGTALTTQTAIGFLLTVVTIQLVPLLAGIVGWQYVFVLLLPGPFLGVLAMHKLAKADSQLNEIAVVAPTQASVGRRSHRL